MDAQQMQMFKTHGIPSGMARKLRRKGINMDNGGSMSEQIKISKMSPRSRLRYKCNQRARNRMGNHAKATLNKLDEETEEKRHQQAVEAAQLKRKYAADRKIKINTKLDNLESEMGDISIERYYEALHKGEAWVISLYERQQVADQSINDLALDEI